MDLILVPTHGAGPFRKLVIGSATEQVFSHPKGEKRMTAATKQAKEKPTVQLCILTGFSLLLSPEELRIVSEYPEVFSIDKPGRIALPMPDAKSLGLWRFRCGAWPGYSRSRRRSHGTRREVCQDAGLLRQF
jgi:hypothetical protein